MKNIPKKAIILVGGLGKRLHPLTLKIPKPLIPFCNKPMLYYQIEKLSKIGIEVIVLALNYYSKMIIESCKEYEDIFNIKIIFSIEKSELGTGGPIGLAKEYLKNGSFFVLNSDILCDVDLNAMIRKYTESTCSALIMTYFVNDPSRYGLIKYTEDRIISFKEKPKEKIKEPGQFMINGGLYIFSDTILDMIEPVNTSLENEIFTQLAACDQMVYYNHKGYWADIGQFEDYLNGQKMYLKLNQKNINSESGIISKNSLVGKKVQISKNVCIDDNTVIGDNVIIGENAVLKNCTIFSNVVIGSNCVIKDSIVGWNSKIFDNSKLSEFTVLGEAVTICYNSCLSGLKLYK